MVFYTMQAKHTSRNCFYILKKYKMFVCVCMYVYISAKTLAPSPYRNLKTYFRWPFFIIV